MRASQRSDVIACPYVQQMPLGTEDAGSKQAEVAESEQKGRALKQSIHSGHVTTSTEVMKVARLASSKQHIVRPILHEEGGCEVPVVTATVQTTRHVCTCHTGTLTGPMKALCPEPWSQICGPTRDNLGYELSIK